MNIERISEQNGNRFWQLSAGEKGVLGRVYFAKEAPGTNGRIAVEGDEIGEGIGFMNCPEPSQDIVRELWANREILRQRCDEGWMNDIKRLRENSYRALPVV